MMTLEKMGEYAFLAFLAIAVIAGAVMGASTDYGTADNIAWVNLAMVILGIIAGFITITEKEAHSFLIAAIALIVASSMSGETWTTINRVADPLGSIIAQVINFVAVFVVPAASILAIKAVYALASKK